MAKLIEFTERHFSHLEEPVKTMLKRIVYRKDFQEAVLALRKKHVIPATGEPLPPDLIQEHRKTITSKQFSQLLHHKPNDALEDDAWNTVNAYGFPFPGTDIELWELIYTVTKYNVLPAFISDEQYQVKQLPQKKLEELATIYDQATRLRGIGKYREADQLIEESECTLYDSHNIQVKTGEGGVIVTLDAGASPKEAKRVITELGYFLGFFQDREQSHGGRESELLDMFNDIADWRRKKLHATKILILIEENYRRYSPASLRTFAKRARTLGF